MSSATSRALVAIALVLLASICTAQTQPIEQGTRRIVIVGDSTASTYDASRWPRTGWGQVLQRYLDPAKLDVRNHAQSGRSARSFIEQGFLDGVVRDLRVGDVLLIQFGHNDAKADDPTRYNEPTRAFPQWLQRYVDLANSAGATPVLITPVARRVFVAGEPQDAHGPYATAVRDLARRDDVVLVDLLESSRNWLRALGDEASREQYLHDPRRGLVDDTHFHERGAVAIACLVAGDLVAQQVIARDALVRDTDCGAKPDALATRAAQPHPSRVVSGTTIARDQPGPHGGNGRTTAFPFFADEPAMPFVFRQRVLHPGASIGLHQHTHDEVYYVIAGRGVYVIDGVVHEVNAGDAMLTRTGSTHTLRQAGEGDLVILIAYPAPPAH